MIYGYGIVDKDNHVYWDDACVCEDKGPMDETCEALNDYDDPRAPYRVIQLQTLDVPPISGALLIAAERQRQIEAEGWTPEHDDEHGAGEMAAAAACYALNAAGCGCEVARNWPWDGSWWKPTTSRRDLVKAGALILAEIERLDRLVAKKQEGK